MGMSRGHHRGSLRAAAAIAGTAALAGVFGVASPVAASDPAILEEHEVIIDGFAFMPPDLEVVAGDTVRWTNVQANTNHTVTDTAGSFDSGVLATGDEFVVEFPEPLPDPVNYQCQIHPFMTGTVTVVPPG